MLCLCLSFPIHNSVGGAYRKGSTELSTLFEYLSQTLPLSFLMIVSAFLSFDVFNDNLNPKKKNVRYTNVVIRQTGHPTHTLTNTRTSSCPKDREGLCEKKEESLGE